MKRILTAAGIGLFFLIIVGAIVFKLIYPSSSKPATTNIAPDPFADISPQVQTIYTDSPYRAAVTCYHWYVHVYINEANANLVASRPEASQCYTQDFIDKWPALIDSTGSDPILLSQDYGLTWESSIQATTFGQSVNSTDEKVVLGTGTEQKELIVHLVADQSGAWKIQSVSNASTGGTQ